ncbi:MAG: cbb3-type cytochrome c oxidase subunit II [Planctomycetota bacterium]|nr:cbb3-type cytochrome c oxidase subunit II [Planctomycetota bacterium]
MAINIHTSHRLLLALSAGTYLILVYLCAVWPAMVEQTAMEALPRPDHGELVARGREVYKSFNCVTCHTQQIRGDARRAYAVDDRVVVPVLEADARFGREVATRAEEYAWQDPVFMGTQRIGPDLSSTGRRLPESQWHYWHLYDPKSVSPGSVMPPHRFLFTSKEPSGDTSAYHEEVIVIAGLGVQGDRLWATPDAVALVEYILSLNREFLEVEGLGR